MLKIESIQNGIVIDHIPAGKGMDIYKPFYILLFFIFHIVSYISGILCFTHRYPEDVKLLLQKICGFFATKMA